MVYRGFAHFVGLIFFSSCSFGEVCQDIQSYTHDFDSYAQIETNESHLACISSSLSCDETTHACLPHSSDYGACLFSFDHVQTNNDDGTFHQNFVLIPWVLIARIFHRIMKFLNLFALRMN